MAVVPKGVLHLLGRDGASVCSSPFGLLTSSTARCTCPTCLEIWDEVKQQLARRPLVTDDSEEGSH